MRTRVDELSRRRGGKEPKEMRRVRLRGGGEEPEKRK